MDRRGGLGRLQAILGLLAALGGAGLIWRLGARWPFAWPLGFLLAAAGLFLIRTAGDDDDQEGGGDHAGRL